MQHHVVCCRPNGLVFRMSVTTAAEFPVQIRQQIFDSCAVLDHCCAPHVKRPQSPAVCCCSRNICNVRQPVLPLYSALTDFRCTPSFCKLLSDLSTWFRCPKNTFVCPVSCQLPLAGRIRSIHGWRLTGTQSRTRLLAGWVRTAEGQYCSNLPSADTQHKLKQ